eukprot:GHVR01173310.1.p1 GENE.GHVR01173310.1~~GHVR01173310.1.p1  ORF type:complete len:124 (+),score=10.22 GHVR01173310.1:1059-1430(+)
MHFTEKLHIIGDEIFFRMSIGNRCSNGTGNKVAEVQKLVSYKGCDTCKDKDGTNSLVVETKNKDRVVLLKLLIEGSDVNTVSKVVFVPFENVMYIYILNSHTPKTTKYTLGGSMMMNFHFCLF